MGKTISIYLEDHVIEWLDFLCGEVKMNRSQLINFILVEGRKIGKDMNRWLEHTQALSKVLAVGEKPKK